jgi:hypothetical protein
MLTGTWTALANPSPAQSSTMLLLSDGTVMIQGSAYTNQWNRLTPDSTGSYAQGTWSSLAPMNLARQFYASNVLKDGRVFVEGGEYSSAGKDTNTGEIYDPVANSWTMLPSFPQSKFGDDPSMLLPDGRVLTGYISGPQTYIFDPAANTWSQAATKLRGDGSDEETWLKLPDDSILTYEIFTQGANSAHAQRYIPATNTWVDAGTVPVLLSSAAVGYEMGPAFVLPDGRAFFVGATGHTAYYTPSTNTWAAGPDIPNGLGADDEPGAMMPDGKILLAVEKPFWNPPTKVYEFDPATNAYTDVTPAGYNLSAVGYHNRMLVLPSGQVLFNNNSAQLEIYTPFGSPNASWKPAITNLTDKGGGTFTLTGTQLNGISQGASFGDDAEMDSNYPIVRIADFADHTYYARTSNWSSTGVATGATPETVDFTMPKGLGTGLYEVSVVGNGIASTPVILAIGTAGVDTVTLDTQSIGNLLFDTIDLNGTSTLIVPSQYSGVYVFTEGGNDIFNVRSTAASLPITLDGGAGNDSFNISPVAKNLNTIQGPVNIRGGGGADGLEVYDQSNAAPATYTLGASGSSTTLTRKGAAVLGADASVKTVILYGGSNNDTYKDQGTPAGTSTLLFGGPGQNTLVGPNADSTWEVVLPGFGSIHGTAQNGPVSFTEMTNLRGGSGDDTFRLDQNGNVPGTIDGGTGTNTLDYSAYTGNIVVDLLLKSATRVSGQVVNIQNVTGSAGNGIIVGGGAPGTLRGGTGRNLIIAGAGASQLYGGGNDDILIAGTTAYDANVAALAKILAEWTQNTPVSLRIQHIENGGGLNGAFDLTAGLNGTVVSNLQTNDLTDGTGTDWLFLRNGVDKQHKAKASDIITPL